MITESQKEQIVRRMEAYIAEHGLSNNKFAREVVRLSPSYISALVNRKWNEMNAGGKLVRIEDKYFRTISAAIGYDLEEALWGHFDTDNHIKILNTLQDARYSKLPVCIDGETGQGKTYSINEYKRQHPGGTYIVTSAGDLTSKGFMVELAEAVGVKPAGDRTTLRKEIVRKLKNEVNPLLIIDESENLKAGAWDSIKSMMDSLKGVCGIAIIGANDFQEALHKKASRGQKNFPQIYSRIKEGGFYKLYKLSLNDIQLVCAASGIHSRSVINKLYEYADNMRELAGAIIRIKRESKAVGENVNGELAETMLNHN